MSSRLAKQLTIALCLGMSGISLGCGKFANRAVPTLTLFKVKSPKDLPAFPASAEIVDLGSLSVRAAPLLTDEETQELFEANLQLAGVLPVRVEMTHNSGDSIELKKIKFRLQDASSTQWKQLSAKQAVSRILNSNSVFAYNPHARKAFEEDVRAYEFDAKTALTHDERRRHGLIFFVAPDKQPVSSPSGLTLHIDGLAQAASLKLN
jgi:hypothetical protein